MRPAADLIISVCGRAEKECPLFPARVERWHWPFDDPAHATGPDVLGESSDLTGRVHFIRIAARPAAANAQRWASYR